MATGFSEFTGTVDAAPTGWVTNHIEDPFLWTFAVKADAGSYGGQHALATDAATGVWERWGLSTPGELTWSTSGPVEILLQWEWAAIGASSWPLPLVFNGEETGAGGPAGAELFDSGGTLNHIRAVDFQNNSDPWNTDTSAAHSAGTITANTKYWARLKITTGRIISAKFWKDGDAEPGSYQHTSSGARGATAGYVGIAFEFAGDPVKFHYFSWGTAGDAAPAPAAGTIDHYYAVYTSGNGASATNAQVIAGTGTGAVTSGSQTGVSDATEQTFTATGLAPSTLYDLEYVVSDGGTNQTRAATTTFRTKSVTGSVVTLPLPPIVRH